MAGWQWGQMCQEQMLMLAWEPLVLGAPSDKPPMRHCRWRTGLTSLSKDKHYFGHFEGICDAMLFKSKFLEFKPSGNLQNLRI